MHLLPKEGDIWELEIAELMPSECQNFENAGCAKVTESGDMEFPLINVKDIGHTGTMNLEESDSLFWRWRLGAHSPKWDFEGLLDYEPSAAAFTMLIASDPQVGVCGDYGQSKVVEQMKTVATLNENTAGVIVNGDLTNTGSWTGSFMFWKNLVSDFNLPVYEGLGNHDYENYYQTTSCVTTDELKEWGKDACPVTKIQYIVSAYETIKEEKWMDSGSRSYAFLLNGYLFVQLHYYPPYEKDMGKGYNTESSILWAKSLLKANSAPVVLNVHDFEYHPEGIADIVASSGGENVIAVFAGHMHAMRGYSKRVGDESHVGTYQVEDVTTSQALPGAEETPDAESGVPPTGAVGESIPVWQSGSMAAFEDGRNCGPGPDLERSFLEVKFDSDNYEVRLWEGDQQTGHYRVQW
ncbi:MAG: metallophosphoesterase [Candidatus Parabeggiatoa sp.]|nr:metallophosphoesterase [Candidatus Parabeggiatoa sp.]